MSEHTAEDAVTADKRAVSPVYRSSMVPYAENDGRPLGTASGGDVGFWERLGTDDGGMPVHLPIGVNAYGQGPEDDSAAYTFTCWCGDPECPLSLALGHAWTSGKRS